MEKKILIITYSFLPYAKSMGDCRRMLNLAEYLLKHNYKVFVLTSDGYYFGYFGCRDRVKDINITYLKDRVRYLQYKRLYDKVDIRNQSVKFFSIWLKVKKFFFNIVKQLIIPDFGIFMVPKYYRKVSQLVKENDIRNVIISSPIHSIQVTGILLKSKFGKNINLITDYRDSWNCSNAHKKSFFVSDYFNKKIERKILTNTDYFTYVSEPMRTKLETMFHLNLSDKAKLVMTGFENRQLEESSLVKDKSLIKIGYFGFLDERDSSYKRITCFFDILENNKKQLSNILISLYGIVKLVNNYSMIHLQGILEHDTALKKMQEMDYLLILYTNCQNSDEVVTGKFFDYISTKKPIVCIGPKNMEVKRLISQYNLGININIFDEKDILKNLLSLKDINKDNFYKNIDVNLFSRDVQYQKFLELLL